jgi:hypothetical protein
MGKTIAAIAESGDVERHFRHAGFTVEPCSERRFGFSGTPEKKPSPLDILSEPTQKPPAIRAFSVDSRA